MLFLLKPINSLLHEICKTFQLPSHEMSHIVGNILLKTLKGNGNAQYSTFVCFLKIISKKGNSDRGMGVKGVK